MSQTAGGGRHGAAGQDEPDGSPLAAGPPASIHPARRPYLTFAGDFLFHDHGSQLLTCPQLAAGASLSADLAYLGALLRAAQFIGFGGPRTGT